MSDSFLELLDARVGALILAVMHALSRYPNETKARTRTLGACGQQRKLPVSYACVLL